MLLNLITLLSTLASLLRCLFRPGGEIPFLVRLLAVFAGSWLALLVLSILVLGLLCLPINQNVPREEDSPFYRRLAGIYAEALIQLFQANVTTQGLENTPADGRFLLVCNHNSFSDPGILLHYFRSSQLAFISKKENRSLFAIGKIMHAMLCQLIDREDDRSALKTILRCVELLKADKASIAVFPEGATNHDDQLHPLRPGVFKIAQRAQVPIVVCVMEGTRKIIGNGLRLKSTDVKLQLVEVIPASELAGQKTTAIAQRVYEAMAGALGG